MNITILSSGDPLGTVPGPKNQLYAKFKLIFNHKTDFWS